jgi:hypothetical protein
LRTRAKAPMRPLTKWLLIADVGVIVVAFVVLVRAVL